MKKYFAYIRVSTVKQGQKGSSLQEQRSAIEGYARRHDLLISEWFEEKETAAKQGRTVFTKMLKALDRCIADGVIIHKIDRSARNLRDWAAIGELIDRGVTVHFAHESLDLNSRGGRLAADIQAVVAADFIRNLRDEVRKGFYGRLKQGLYPIRAPIGYLDAGGGLPKVIDPLRGPMVRKCFELYATAHWSLLTLREEMTARGLRNHTGNPVSLNGLSTILNNPFYIGIIRLKKTGELFQGVHDPIIDKFTFDRVQVVLDDRLAPRTKSHRFRYQRTIRCSWCRLSLIGERQKGHVYYRCHNQSCPPTCLSENLIDDTLRTFATQFALDAPEWKIIETDAESALRGHVVNRADELRSLSLAISAIDDRIGRLTDAYIDQTVDLSLYTARKEKLLHDRAAIASRKAIAEGGTDALRQRIEKILELLKTLENLPDLANGMELRDFLKATTSNFSVDQKNVVIAWEKPFERFITSIAITSGEPHRGDARTKVDIVREIIREIIEGEIKGEPPAELAA